MVSMMKRPNMNPWFAHQIDQHVNGPRWNGPRLPQGVARVEGSVTSSVITVTMHDGTVYKWSGGRYSARKINLCYAPLMPKPVKGE